MPRPRQSLALAAAGVGVIVAALAGAPFAAADPPPGCEVSGSNTSPGGQTTECMSPGNVEIDVKPPSAPSENAFFGFPAFGFI